jgi:competence/damage-inducible protein CinA-like protein
MPSAEIITIGTEILLGEILDTNAQTIAQTLRENGIDLYRKTTIGDNPGRIAQAIRESLERCEIVITTGGLGPTVDDPTREAVARAIQVELEFRPELWEQIQARFQRYNRQPTDNNRRQAYIPRGAQAIENPVGTAPSFVIELGQKCIIALPGVPSEMRFLLRQAVIPYLREHYRIHSVIKNRNLHTAGIGESQIDSLIGDLEALSNPTVGLAAHSGQVDVRVVAKADSEVEADRLIAEIEGQLRQRLGDWIYGADKESLEAVAIAALDSQGWSLAVVEAGSSGELSRRLSGVANPLFRGGEVVAELLNPENLLSRTDDFRRARLAQVGFGLSIQPGPEQQKVFLVLITPEQQEQYERPYGGPPDYAPRWAVHHSLDLIRKLRKENK